MVITPIKATRLCTILEVISPNPDSITGCILINSEGTQFFSRRIVCNMYEFSKPKIFVGDARFMGTEEQLKKNYVGVIQPDALEIFHNKNYTETGIPVSNMNLSKERKREIDLLGGSIIAHVERIFKKKSFKDEKGEELIDEFQYVPSEFLKFDKNKLYLVDNQIITKLPTTISHVPQLRFVSGGKIN